MASLVRELPLGLKHGGAGVWTPRERRVKIQKLSVAKNMNFARGLGFGLHASVAPVRTSFARASATTEKPICREFKGSFVEELRFQAMRLQLKEPANAASVEEYLKFLVNSKQVYETMEAIILHSSHPSSESHLD